MTNKKTSTGEKLRALRGDKSKKEVADSLGISFSSYVKYERDERIPKDSVKVRIAKYYKTTVEAIFFA